LVVGDKEIKAKTVNVRVRGEKVLGSMALEKFLKLIQADLAKKRQV
jgi:threonyl-tRNA synthetase